MSQSALAGGVRDAVFLSYSHDDEQWRRKFTQILAPVVRNQRLVMWDDTHIPVGDDWRRDISDGVQRASAALVLVSGSYLASRFIMDEELPELIAHGVRLVPVLVEDSLWDQEPRLAAVQWAHDPGRDGPLAAADPREVPGRIVRMCRRLLEIAPLTGQPSPAPAPSPVRGLAGQAEALVPGPAGLLHDVPELPPQYLVREELEGVRAALLGSGAGAVGLTGDARALGLSGQGGIGKTVLAAAVARDPVVRGHFPDGVFWVTAGEQPDLTGLQADLLARLGVADAAPRSATEGAGLLYQALAGRQVLLVADDVWSVAAAETFRVTGPQGRVLYTTRDRAVLEAAGAAEKQVGMLPAVAARKLLARTARVAVDRLPEPTAARVLAATGGVALAVALAGGAIRGGAPWEQVADELDRGADTFLDHPYANAFRALQAATAALDPTLAAAYVSLAVYPPDTRIPVAAIARYWGQLCGSTLVEVRADLQNLADRELLVLSQEEISFHDLQHSYLQLQADNLPLLHADLLTSYRALLPAATTGWWRLPSGEPYIWDHLLHHLLGAGDRSAAASTLTDLAYLVMRLALAGPHAAEDDLVQGLSAFPDDPQLAWLRKWLALHTHVLAGQARPSDVATTLAGWLTKPPQGISLHGLGSLLPSFYLVPRWGMPNEIPALQRVLADHVGSVYAVAFSPDGRYLATASNDQTVRLWDTAAGTTRATLTGHTNRVRAVAFSPDGRHLATASDDRTARLWDTTTGTTRAILTGHAGPVKTVAFSPDGRHLATASDDRTARLWDTTTGTTRTTLTGHTRAVNAVAFSPDGQRLATASNDRTARLWDTTTGTTRTTLTGHTRAVNAVAFSPDGQRLATASNDRTARLWDTTTGTTRTILIGHTRTVNAVTFSPDGRYLATASNDQTVRLWDTTTGTTRTTFTGHTNRVISVAFSPGGRHLATAGNDRTARLWDTATGITTPASLTGHAHWVNAVAFSPDGRQLASASDDQTARLWDTTTGTTRATLTGHTGIVNAVAFSPDGRQLATASNDQTARLWDTTTGTTRAILTGHINRVKAVAFSPDGRLLATASDDRTVQLWDTTTCTTRAILTGHTRAVNAVAFRQDGSQLASASDDQTVRLWYTATGTTRATYTSHTNRFRAVAFSPDGRRFATAIYDNTVRLWDTTTGTTRTLTGHAHWVNALVFSPEGRYLATASNDQTVRLWDVITARVISVLRLDAPILGLAWSQNMVALGNGTYVVLLDVKTH